MVIVGGPAWGSLNQDVKLTRIPRASSITAIDANIESSTIININRASSSFTHTITYSFAGLTGTIATKTSSTSVGWTIPSSFYGKIPNAKTGEVTLTCTTYSGSTAVGTSTTKFTVTASKEKCRPTVTATLIDSNPETVALTGDSSKLIKYKSTAKVTPTATAKNSATIKKITVNGTTMSGTYVAFTNVQSETFKVEVTDSREYTNEEYILKPTIIPYIPLSANIEVYRPTDTSSEIKVKYDGKFFNGSFETATNTLTMTWKCTTKQDTSTIVAQGTLTPTTSGNTFSGDVSLGTDYDYQQDYIFTFTIKDKLSILAPAIPLKRGIPYFDYGIDVNGNNYFNVNGDIYRNNENILTYLLKSGTNGRSSRIDGQNVDSIRDNGFYYGNNLINAPTAYGYLLVISHSTSSNYAIQIFAHQTSGDNVRIYIRQCDSGNWGSWRQFSLV